MKKYVKPMAEYIDFDFKNLITAGEGGMSADIGVGDGGFSPDDE